MGFVRLLFGVDKRNNWYRSIFLPTRRTPQCTLPDVEGSDRRVVRDNTPQKGSGRRIRNEIDNNVPLIEIKHPIYYPEAKRALADYCAGIYHFSPVFFASHTSEHLPFLSCLSCKLTEGCRPINHFSALFVKVASPAMRTLSDMPRFIIALRKKPRFLVTFATLLSPASIYAIAI